MPGIQELLAALMQGGSAPGSVQPTLVNNTVAGSIQPSANGGAGGQPGGVAPSQDDTLNQARVLATLRPPAAGARGGLGGMLAAASQGSEHLKPTSRGGGWAAGILQGLGAPQRYADTQRALAAADADSRFGSLMKILKAQTEIGNQGIMDRRQKAWERSLDQQEKRDAAAGKPKEKSAADKLKAAKDAQDFEGKIRGGFQADADKAARGALGIGMGPIPPSKMGAYNDFTQKFIDDKMAPYKPGIAAAKEEAGVGQPSGSSTAAGAGGGGTVNATPNTAPATAPGNDDANAEGATAPPAKDASGPAGDPGAPGWVTIRNSQTGETKQWNQNTGETRDMGEME